MNERKNRKFQAVVVVSIILLLVAPFVLFSLGHYGAGFVVFGIWMPVFSSILIGTKNEEVY